MSTRFASLRRWVYAGGLRIAELRQFVAKLYRSRGKMMLLPLIVLWILVMVGATLSAQPVLPPLSFDSSYELALYMAFMRHATFGTDVVWTYGPYGWLNSPFLFDLPLARVAIGVNLAAVFLFFGVLAANLRLRRVAALHWLLVAVLLGLFVDWNDYVTTDNLLIYSAIGFITLCAATANRRVAGLYAIVAGLLLAVASLVKDTDSLLALIFLTICIIYGVLAARVGLALVTIGAFAAAFGLLWVLEGGGLVGLPAYWRSVYEFSSGYSAAMSRPNDYHLVLIAAAFVIAALGFGTVSAVMRRRTSLGLVLATSTFVAFVAFKDSFVRFSYLSFFITLIFILCLSLPETFASKELGSANRGGYIGGWWAVAGLVVGVLITTVPYIPRQLSSSPAQVAYSYKQAWWSTEYPTFRDRQHQSVIDAIQERFPLDVSTLKAISGSSVDVMPTDIDVIYGYGLTWDPRPVFQSYAAYTPYLDEIDAQHISSAAGAQHILYYYDPTNLLDQRYPPFDEPASFRALLQNYQVIIASTWSVLERRAHPLADLSTMVGRTCGTLGEWIQVPQSAPGRYTYGSLDVPYTLSGAIRNVIYKTGQLQIQFELDDGSTSPPFRLIQRVAGDGLFLSGYLDNPTTLRDVWSGKIDHSIQSFKVSALPDAGDFVHSVCTTFVSWPAPSPE